MNDPTDVPIDCPQCEGTGEIGSKLCLNCQGQGEIILTAFAYAQLRKLQLEQHKINDFDSSSNLDPS